MKAAYWIFTGLIAALMIVSAIPDVLVVEGAVQIFEHLGYPRYLLPFIGVAKLLGGAAILQPWFPRLKEWAYAGITFDLIGAIYSHISVGDAIQFLLPPLLGLVLTIGSYATMRILDSRQSSPAAV
jgi:uncharacterized membrane protein YphA (DoxX/SURF4 family)